MTSRPGPAPPARAHPQRAGVAVRRPWPERAMAAYRAWPGRQRRRAAPAVAALRAALPEALEALEARLDRPAVGLGRPAQVGGRPVPRARAAPRPLAALRRH